MGGLDKILDLSGPKALGLFLACLILKIANIYGYVRLADTAPYASTVNDVVMILAGALAAMWLGGGAVRWVRSRRALRQQRRAVRDYLTTLSAQEARMLLEMPARNTRSLNTQLYDPTANLLVQRGC